MITLCTTATLTPVQRGSAVIMVDEQGRGPSQRTLAAVREQCKPSWEGDDVMLTGPYKHPDDSAFPVDTGVNPVLANVKAAPGHLTRSGGFRMSAFFQAHSHAVSGLVALRRAVVMPTIVMSHCVVKNVDQEVVYIFALFTLAMHPRKNILCTTSDDHTWKMWAVPGGEVIMTGEGHTDWVADCDFHPSLVLLLFIITSST